MKSSLGVNFARENGQLAFVPLDVGGEGGDFLQLSQYVHHEGCLARADLPLDHGDIGTVLVRLYVVPFDPLNSALNHLVEANSPSI